MSSNIEKFKELVSDAKNFGADVEFHEIKCRESLVFEKIEMRGMIDEEIFFELLSCDSFDRAKFIANKSPDCQKLSVSF